MLKGILIFIETYLFGSLIIQRVRNADINRDAQWIINRKKDHLMKIGIAELTSKELRFA
jgi:hypothetical protein